MPSTEVEVFLAKRVRGTRQTERGNRRGGATKKCEISRTLLSINLHFSVYCDGTFKSMTTEGLNRPDRSPCIRLRMRTFVISDWQAPLHRRGPRPLHGLPDAGQPRQGVQPHPRVRLRPLPARPRARVHAGAEELQTLPRRPTMIRVKISSRIQGDSGGRVPWLG